MFFFDASMHLCTFITAVFCLLQQNFVRGEQKCCGDLGCFRLEYPWVSLSRPVPPPKCPDECPMNYVFYSRKNLNENYTLTGWPETPFNYTDFDNNKKTVFFVHGWRTPANFSLYQDLKNAYLDEEDVNWIFADWGDCINDNYLQAVSTTRVLAAQSIRFIRYLISDYGLSPFRLHLIGISLGSPIASYIGKGIPGILRLTGLDPAKPLFEHQSKEVEIDQSDAYFVEIGHSESFPIVGFGIHEPAGHVDYYFNGDLVQPGCGRETVSNAIAEIRNDTYDLGSAISSIVNFLTCNHGRILYYYIEAIKSTNCTFWGERLQIDKHILNGLSAGWLSRNLNTLQGCTITSCSPWGLKSIDYPARGSFSVSTRSKEPFCIPEPEVDNKMANLLKEYRNLDTSV